VTLSLAPFLLLAANSPGGSEIPAGPLYAAVAGLTGAIAYVFKLLIDSHERRHTETLAHHDSLVESVKKEREQTTEDRKAHIARLESLVGQIAGERTAQQREMVTAITTNIEAIRANTLAREKANSEIAELMKEVPKTVIVALSELGMLPLPAKPAKG